MRPVVQKAVARAAIAIMEAGLLPWPKIMQRLAQLDWRMESSPWEAVFSVDGAKMLTGKENTDLLFNLLRVHIAPKSKSEIGRVCKDFKNVRNKKYPISEDDLAKNIVDFDDTAPAKVIDLPKEISSDGEG
ncbi:MAG: hypothetical protein KA978_32750 [Deltaproteobacteria bacterium]|nr:hypothetical protein [Deltaproteobacteria bacterium]